MKGRCPEIERRRWLGAAPGDAELNELLVLQRQAAGGFAGRGLDCVENGGRAAADGGFAPPRPKGRGRGGGGFFFLAFRGGWSWLRVGSWCGGTVVSSVVSR